MEPSRCLPDWVPALCRLPRADLPGRRRELDELLGGHEVQVERLGPRHVRFRLTGGADLLAQARDLADRETACCSFFDFRLSYDDQAARVVVDVRVPPEQTRVLEALANRAAVRREVGPMRAGAVARAAGVNRQTLRYYERRGLIAEPERTLGGHRRYPPETVPRLRAIKAAQGLGFTLEEAAGLVTPSGRTPAGRGLLAGAEAKLVEIDARLAELTSRRAQLVAAVAAGCDDLMVCAEEDCCPISFRAQAAG